MLSSFALENLVYKVAGIRSNAEINGNEPVAELADVLHTLLVAQVSDARVKSGLPQTSDQRGLAPVA